MRDSIRVIRQLRRAWLPRARTTAAAIIAATGLALLAAAAYGSSPSAGVRGSSKARESAYSRSTSADNTLDYSRRPHNKVPPGSGHETRRQAEQDYAQLRGWAKCMRRRGYPRMPEPKYGKPQPNGHGGTAVGWGAAYLLMPEAYDAYSQRFQNKAKTCGIDPLTSRPHH